MPCEEQSFSPLPADLYVDSLWSDDAQQVGQGPEPAQQ